MTGIATSDFDFMVERIGKRFEFNDKIKDEIKDGMYANTDARLRDFFFAKGQVGTASYVCVCMIGGGLDLS